MLDNVGAQFVVAQPGFWVDLNAMRRFENVLEGSHFQLIRRFPMKSNYNALEKELLVYRNLGNVVSGPVHLQIGVPIIQGVISGTVGNGQ
jgi:hypothetical protein